MMDDEKKKYSIAYHSDPACSSKHRWGRAPGFYNTKSKHNTGDGPPMVNLVWIDLVTAADAPLIKKSNCIEPSLAGKSNGETDHFNRLYKMYKVQSVDNPQFIVDSLITRDDYAEGKNSESEIDFAFILALIRRGYCDEAIEQRILSERDDWKHHKGSEDAYLMRSITNAHEYLQHQQN